MSRVGKKEINIPEKTEVKVNGNHIIVKGVRGEIERYIHPRIKVELNNGKIKVIRESDSQQDKSLHGLTRTLIYNMIYGVTQGFDKTLEIQGVGYKAEKQKNRVMFYLGYSRAVDFPVPDEINIDIEKNIIKVSGIDKEKVGLISAKIRNLRAPDPYKGKGIRYSGEKLKLKPGKSAKAK